MLSSVAPSLVVGIQLSLMLFGGVALVLVGSTIAARRRRTAVAQHPPTTYASAAASAPNAPSQEGNASFFGGTVLPANSHVHSRGSAATGSQKQIAFLPAVLILVGAVLAGVACVNIYRNMTLDLSDYGMPDRLLGLESAGLGSNLGQDIKDLNTKHDGDGVDLRGAIYGSPSQWIGTAISQGSRVADEKAAMARQSESAFTTNGGGWAMSQPIVNWTDADPGPMGGSMRCGHAASADAAMCIWAAGDVLGIVWLGGSWADFADDVARSARTELGI